MSVLPTRKKEVCQGSELIRVPGESFLNQSGGSKGAESLLFIIFTVETVLVL
jgi:hypothetical protein